MFKIPFSLFLFILVIGGGGGGVFVPLLTTTSSIITSASATLPSVAEHQINLCYISQVPIYGKLALFFMREYYPNISKSSSSSLSPAFQAIDYAEVPSNIEFTISLFGVNGNGLMKDLASEILSSNFNDCDVVIGPGLSGFAITMSGLFSTAQPWLCYAATNILLSNKDSYPSFSRVVPTDTFAAHGTVAVMKAFNYKSASILANNIDSARSLIAVVEAEIGAQSGDVYTQFMETNADNSTIKGALEGVEARPYRVLLILLEGWSDAFVRTMALIKEQKLDEKYVIIYGESICSGYGSLIYTLPGGFCAVYQLQTETYRTEFYHAAYIAEQALSNTTLGLYRDELVANGFTEVGSGSLRPAADYSVDSYELMSIDAISHAMGTAILAASNGKNISVPSVLRAAFKDYSTMGMSGKVQLDSSGDRLSVMMNLTSIDASGSLNAFATYDYPNDPIKVADYESKIYFPFSSDGRVPTSDIKPEFITSAPSDDSSSLSAGAIVGIIVAIVVAIAVVVIAIVYCCVLPRLNSPTRYAVTNETKPFACLVTTIADYDDLCVRLPEEMPDAIQLYNDTISALAHEYGCYESSVLESYEHVIVARDVESIARLAMAIHTTLYSSTWGCFQALDKYYITQDGAVDDYLDAHQAANQSSPSYGGVENSTNINLLPPPPPPGSSSVMMNSASNRGGGASTSVSHNVHAGGRGAGAGGSQHSTSYQAGGIRIPSVAEEANDVDMDDATYLPVEMINHLNTNNTAPVVGGEAEAERDGSGGEDADAVMESSNGKAAAAPSLAIGVLSGGDAVPKVISSRQLAKNKKARKHRRRTAWGGLRVQICIDYGHGTVAKNIASAVVNDSSDDESGDDEEEEGSEFDSKQNKNSNSHIRKKRRSSVNNNGSGKRKSSVHNDPHHQHLGYIYNGSVVIQATGLHECCYGGQTLVSDRASKYINDATLRKRLNEVSLVNPHAVHTSSTGDSFLASSDPASGTSDSNGPSSLVQISDGSSGSTIFRHRVAYELRTPVLNRRFPPPYIKKKATAGAENAVTVYDETSTQLKPLQVPANNNLGGGGTIAPSTHAPSLSLTDNRTHTLKLSSHVSMETRRQQQRQQQHTAVNSVAATNPLSVM